MEIGELLDGADEPRGRESGRKQEAGSNRRFPRLLTTPISDSSPASSDFSVSTDEFPVSISGVDFNRLVSQVSSLQKLQVARVFNGADAAHPGIILLMRLDCANKSKLLIYNIKAKVTNNYGRRVKFLDEKWCPKL